MARYNVYPNPSGAGYLLDVQADILSGLNTRVVVPLLPVSESPKLASYLNPVFMVGGRDVVMLTQFLASIPESELKRPLDNLGQSHNEIMAALDMLLTGF